ENRADIMSSIHDGFAGLELYIAKPFVGENLDGGKFFFQEQGTTPGATIIGLFNRFEDEETYSGTCGAFSLLFKHVLELQGIEGLETKALFPKLGYNAIH